MTGAGVPFVDLAAGHAELREDIEAAWRRVLASNRFILGEEVERFEHAFAAYCGVTHCIGVGSGLAALRLILQALDIGPGDEVIVPGHTFIATWLAVSQAGAQPIPVDVDWQTCTLDPALIEAAISARTRAIVPVHLYGQPAHMRAIGDIAARHGLAVIEDAAQAHGARCDGRRAGALGLAAGFSFYPTKNLGALGDGGAVVTGDAGIAARVRRLRNYGALDKHDHDVQGTNSRLDELQAAILRPKLRALDSGNERRAAAAARYVAMLAGIPLTLPHVPADTEPAWHLFAIRSPARDRLRTALSARGIETLVHYPRPPYRCGAYASPARSSSGMPVTERVCAQTLSLPLWPQIDEQQQMRVAGALAEALREID